MATSIDQPVFKIRLMSKSVESKSAFKYRGFDFSIMMKLLAVRIPMGQISKHLKTRF